MVYPKVNMNKQQARIAHYQGIKADNDRYQLTAETERQLIEAYGEDYPPILDDWGSTTTDRDR